MAGGSAQSQRGSKEAEEIIRQENELRTETGQPTVEEELKNLTNKEARLEATINELKQIVKASKRDNTLSEKKSGNGEYFYQDENGNIDHCRYTDKERI